jgi:hypothetical protein
MNGDGHPDLIWRNRSTGENLVWLMVGASHMATMALQAVDQSWDLVQAVDMNSDGSADLLWRNSTTGDNLLWYMNGLAVAGKAVMPSVPDLNWKIVR